MGTEIQKLSPRADDFPDKKEGFNDGLVLTRPEWIKAIHRRYLASGADCIETNTFGSKAPKYNENARTVRRRKNWIMTKKNIKR
jgi:5-methyltetrahydrofolate--homocysteine methyltransferase